MEAGRRPRLTTVTRRPLALGALAALVSLTACGAGSGGGATSTTSATSTTNASATTTATTASDTATAGGIDETRAAAIAKAHLLGAAEVKALGLKVVDQPKFGNTGTWWWHCSNFLPSDPSIRQTGFGTWDEPESGARVQHTIAVYTDAASARTGLAEAKQDLAACKPFVKAGLDYAKFQLEPLAALKGTEAAFAWCESVTGAQSFQLCNAAAIHGNELTYVWASAGDKKTAEGAAGVMLGLTIAKING